MRLHRRMTDEEIQKANPPELWLELDRSQYVVVLLHGGFTDTPQLGPKDIVEALIETYEAYIAKISKELRDDLDFWSIE